MDTQPPAFDALTDLRGCLRDMVALSALPAVWVGSSPAAIAASLAEALARLLHLELVYVRLDQAAGELIEVAHTQRRQEALARARELGRALTPWLTATDRGSRPVAHPPGLAGVRLSVAPIRYDGGNGLVAAGARRPDFATEHEHLLLRAGANQAAIALHAARLAAERTQVEEALRARVRQQAAVAHLGQRALLGADAAALMDEAAALVADTLAVEYCKVLELLPDGAGLRLCAGVGWRAGVVGWTTLDAGSGSHSGYTLAAGVPVIVEDLRAERRFAAPPLLREHGVVSGLSCIIHGPGSPFGVLGAHTCRRRVFTVDDVNFLQAVANVLATAIGRHRDEQERAQLLAREQAARTAAEAALRTRDEFLSIASHELRNPVAGLKGTAELLRRARQRGQLDGARLDRYLATIEQTSAHLAALTEDLLDVSRLQHGTLPLRTRPTDLADLVSTAVARLEGRAEAHRLLVNVTAVPGAMVVDPDRVEQIVTNLVENAIKYSPGGGAIHITLGQDCGGAMLHVRDEGIGLPAGASAAIFEPFGRAPNAAAQNIPGLGLGLYICRRIAEQHGGRLWAESAGEGRGTTMTLWLPSRPREPDREAADG